MRAAIEAAGSKALRSCVIGQNSGSCLPSEIGSALEPAIGRLEVLGIQIRGARQTGRWSGPIAAKAADRAADFYVVESVVASAGRQCQYLRHDVKTHRCECRPLLVAAGDIVEECVIVVADI